MNAESIRIESEDRGFELILDLDEDVCTHGNKHARVHVNIHSIAEELYDAVTKQIGPYIDDMRAAEREYRSGRADDPSQQAILDRIKGDPYEDLEDGPWPGESVQSYYERTGQDGPLREVADALNKARKES